MIEHEQVRYQLSAKNRIKRKRKICGNMCQIKEINLKTNFSLFKKKEKKAQTRIFYNHFLQFYTT